MTIKICCLRDKFFIYRFLVYLHARRFRLVYEYFFAFALELTTGLIFEVFDLTFAVVVVAVVAVVAVAAVVAAAVSGLVAWVFESVYVLL